jgi:hypothetical protein
MTLLVSLSLLLNTIGQQWQTVVCIVDRSELLEADSRYLRVLHLLCNDFAAAIELLHMV